MVINKKKASMVISQGGFVASDNKKSLKKFWKVICLRMPDNLFADVDNMVKERAGMTRVGWILEAIQEKVKKEKE